MSALDTIQCGHFLFCEADKKDVYFLPRVLCNRIVSQKGKYTFAFDFGCVLYYI